MGADDSEIRRLNIQAIRVRELLGTEAESLTAEEPVSFAARPLPSDALSFSEYRTFLSLTSDDYLVPQHISHKINYVVQRGINLGKYEFYISDQTDHSLHQRIIIPCVWKNQVIGYTSRAVVDGVKPKYYSQYESNFVFNVDTQQPDWKFVIVCEGPFDAMSVDGVAVLGSECSEIQANIIDSLAREVIVVPDRDQAGQKLVRAALEYGWTVAFPKWFQNCKDINEAVTKYGKLFVVKDILETRVANPIKIELMSRGLHN